MRRLMPMFIISMPIFYADAAADATMLIVIVYVTLIHADMPMPPPFFFRCRHAMP